MRKSEYLDDKVNVVKYVKNVQFLSKIIILHFDTKILAIMYIKYGDKLCVNMK